MESDHLHSRLTNSANLKKLLVVVAGLAVVHGLSAAEGPHPPAGEKAGPSPPYVIHYGLNDSHGRSWVRENSHGVIGITYFQRDEGSYDEGTLLYRTIWPDNTKRTEAVTTGRRLEKSVLLYDIFDRPHIFVARSSDVDQAIIHYFKNNDGLWRNEAIVNFCNEGGKFIYELSAETGPGNAFHLLVLKTRSNPDSNDYMNCWMNAYLYHLTNVTGTWEKEWIHNLDTPYTYDHYIKPSIRQDMKIDSDGFVHVAFGVQITGTYNYSKLMYATNRTGSWQMETALTNTYGPVDDAGWFPSLCLDSNNAPSIACIYINRVLTYSATYSKLLLLKRLGAGNWSSETVANYDDGYYGADGRDYTGALCHLVIDENGTPRIIFSDIASTHWNYQRLNVGNIRYAFFADGQWHFNTIYRQPLPAGFFSATEMLWMCMVVSSHTNTVHIIGQEIVVTGAYQYTCSLLEFALEDNQADSGTALPCEFRLFQNYPNPFSPGTSIEFDLPQPSPVSVTVYNVMGQQVRTLVNDEFPGGRYSLDWDGTDQQGKRVPAGVYFCRLKAANFAESRKMLLLK